MSRKTGLAELGEFGLIERIKEQAGSAPFLRLGIGDDCSILDIGADEELLTSTDLLIEGIHFDLTWTNFEQLGRKSVAVNISDIAAMGGRPKSLYLGVAIPPTISVENLEQFVAGVLFETTKHGAVLAGGDTSRSPGPLIISVTVQGTAKKGQAICRSGARNGDLIFVSGTLGDSALALQQLQSGESATAELAQRHHCPRARTELGLQLVARNLAHSMIDISDGLVADLSHILEASVKGAVLHLARVPLSSDFSSACRQQPDLIDLALTGGEDYELLFTVDPEFEADIKQLSAEINLSLTRIGTVQEQPELNIVCEDGNPYLYRKGGFDHFASGGGG